MYEKKKKKGKPQVSFSSNLSFDKISRKPHLQNIYAQGSNGKFNPNASTSWGPKISELPNDPTYGGNTDNTYTKQSGKVSSSGFTMVTASQPMTK